MRKQTLWRLAAIAVAGLVVFYATRLRAPVELGGSVIEPAGPAPEIILHRTSGDSFRLSDLRGQVVLLFFGYTHCPDVCPTTLSDMKYVFERLGRAADSARFLFVTVDVPRDNPEEIRRYLDLFNPDFIGLTGTQDELETVYADYFVGVSAAPAAGIAGYEVAHTSRIFVIDQDGRLVETLAYGVSRDLILRDVQVLLNR